MIFGLDLDGVVRDIVGYWLEHYAKHLNLDYELLRNPRLEHYAPRKIVSKLWCEDVQLHAPMYPDARKFFDEVMHLDNVQVVIITSQPNLQCRCWVHRWVWHNIGPVPVVIGSPGYDKSIAKCSVFVDDFLENVLAVRDRHRECAALLRDRPWNRDVDHRVMRIYSLLDLLDFLPKLQSKGLAELR